MLPIEDYQRSRNGHKTLKSEYRGTRVSVEIVKVKLGEFDKMHPNRLIVEERIFYIGAED